MTTEQETPVEERLSALLDHLGIERAHFAARDATELERLCLYRPESASSLTLVSASIGGPGGLTNVDVLRPYGDRLLAFFADSPRPPWARLRQAVSEIPGARLVSFREGYAALGWDDVAVDLADQLASSMLESVGAAEMSHPATQLRASASEGEAAGVTYQVRGDGPALVLFPLALAPSQWEPLIPALSERFTTITLGGAHLGTVAHLEARARSAGYRRAVRTMLGEAAIQAGERVLEVGCGTGALVRDLARATAGANPITGVDHSPYLLREAATLARAEGLEGAIEFREGDAQALSIEDEAYGVTFSSTVMEEVDADRMMAELLRVTRPGGRVAVAVRALDLPPIFNLDLPDDIRRKLDALPGGVSEGGCADASLYRRFAGSGLADIRTLPTWMWNPAPSYMWDTWVEQGLHLLTPEERETFREAARRGIEAGTAFAGRPLHVAVGTKP